MWLAGSLPGKHSSLVSAHAGTHFDFSCDKRPLPCKRPHNLLVVKMVSDKVSHPIFRGISMIEAMNLTIDN